MPAPTGWQTLGTVTVTATSPSVAVGTVSISNSATSIWLRVVQNGGDSPWPFGYGLAGWVTVNGRELGTAKVWGRSEGEVARLWNGLKPQATTGVIVFEPRSYTLRWLETVNGSWSLTFQWQAS